MMMRFLGIVFCFILLCGFSPYNAVVDCYNAAGGGEPCASCNSAIDSKIVDPGNTVTAEVSSTDYRAYQFTTATTKCVTGAFFAGDGNGDGTKDVTCEIWGNDGSPTSIVGAGYTGEVENIDATGDPENEVLFSATQTLSAGTYWLVCRGTGGVQIGWGRDGGGSGTYKYSSDGSSWSASSYYIVMGVLGCDP
jgi:hypothetical protein